MDTISTYNEFTEKNELIFCLQKRQEATIVFISVEDEAKKEEIIYLLESELREYKFDHIDTGTENIISLYKYLNNALPDEVLKSQPTTHVVIISGLGKDIKNDKKQQKLLKEFAAQLNFERELLFHKLPFIIIIFSNKEFFKTLEVEAPDFCNWVTYKFNFHSEPDHKEKRKEYEFLRVFLSSTAIDMQEHRKKTSDALLRLEHLPVMMETFGAMPNSPVAACKERVLQAGALVVMIAHRYGWVPSIEEGGDGKKSITWLEVETALENNIPVFAYIVDPNYGWTQPKEQDRLVNEISLDKKIEILQTVDALQEFKNFLESNAGLVRNKFTTPEDLALKVTTSLAGFANTLKPGSQKPTLRPPFVFRIVHPLQPAPHFKGRKVLLADLARWWKEPVTPDRVRSLVAIGGTGKTAIVERFLNTVKDEALRGSVLVWSFYEDDNTDAFLREACRVFTGEEPVGPGGMLERLQRALSAENYQHLLVLDGLERIQSEGKSNYSKGDLEDHRIKNLLRSIAAGLGNTRALITSRFPLTDLKEWENAGYKSFNLEMLDEESAIEVLKAWDIQGNDQELNKLAAYVGYHALSVSVLGSFLNQYHNGDPEGFKEFKLEEITPEESQAARLGRILDGYAKNLPDQERDFLLRLSEFSKGITIDILGYLVDAGGDIAGTLVGTNQHRLIIIADRLKRQGLIFSYKNGDKLIYTAHPFLREYFRELLKKKLRPEELHEVVMNKISIGLDTKPENKPTDSAILNRYEELIEQSILAGHYQEAYDLYSDVMTGGRENYIFHNMGDYGRIVRISSLFSENGTPSTAKGEFSNNELCSLINLWGLAADAFGDLTTANKCFSIVIDYSFENRDYGELPQYLLNKAYINLRQGSFPEAKKILESSFENLINQDVNENAKFHKWFYNTYLGYALHFLGDISLANQHFLEADKLKEEGFFTADTDTAECLIDSGLKKKSIELANQNLFISEENQWPRQICLSHYILGILSLSDSIVESGKHLQKVREWSEKSGEIGCIIKGHILASEIAYHSQDYPSALAEATTGLNHAESCGFGKLAIDLLLLLSKIHLAIPVYKTALSFARRAYDWAALPECSNAWGQANGLHLCGVCHKGLGKRELAVMRLEAALVIREKIEHPEAGETRRLLEELGGRK